MSAAQDMFESELEREEYFERADPTNLRAESAEKDILGLVSRRTLIEGKDNKDKDKEKAKVSIQSMDYEEAENNAWRLHQTRRFYHDIGHWWTATRRTTAWKWFLIIFIGIVVGAMGVFVTKSTGALTEYKLKTTLALFKNERTRADAFFAFVFLSLSYAAIAACCCIFEPGAVGSGIPEVKAYLNGMIFAVSAGLPLGKEGPMIHCGAVIGAAVSQGKTFTFGFDTSWTKFQDLRNDRSKRDFVTFGAAAAVAAAFSAPIGGVLFTLEEGASFWSTTLTFRAFFSAMVTELTINLILTGFSFGNNLGRDDTRGSMFPFGYFSEQPYRPYELIFFILLGCAGGLLGALFNYLNMRVSLYRTKSVNKHLWKRILEIAVITMVFATLCFVLPIMYNGCTLIPSEIADFDEKNAPLLDELVQLQCPAGYYNQLASLYLIDPNTAMQLLFHLPLGGFDTIPLFMFFIPYFLSAACVSGSLIPAGLFVPTLLSGAAFGRMFGRGLNAMLPGYVSDSGVYALLGASSLMGGMCRLTMAGTVIMLEACGNNEYLLPLMLVFATARYTGNAINLPMYDIQIELKGLPFLDSHLNTMGMLNYHSISAVMAKPVHCLETITKTSKVHWLLSNTKHNGFPVVDNLGRLKGFILRKTLCTMLKLKALSRPIFDENDLDQGIETVQVPEGYVQLSQTAIISHDTLERNYPKYPQIEEIMMTADDMMTWTDVRYYMDTAPFALSDSSSISKCYRLFRTMGLRHLVLTDDEHRVTGIITRHDITEHKLSHEWKYNGEEMKTYYKVSASEPAFVPEKEALMGDGLKYLNEDSDDNDDNDDKDNDNNWSQSRATFEIDMIEYNKNKTNATSQRIVQDIGEKASADSYTSAKQH